MRVKIVGLAGCIVELIGILYLAELNLQTHIQTHVQTRKQHITHNQFVSKHAAYLKLGEVLSLR